jgi:hypothetical protein
MKLLLMALTVPALFADGAGRMESKYAAQDFVLTADPAAAPWKDVKPVVADKDRYGKAVAGHRTEIRSRWTDGHLYILFVCPYEELNLKPSPSATTETNKLWDWDVAEVFIGSDFQKINRYREFQVSPQGEWVDLDIDSSPAKTAEGWRWNSGFEVKARIDEAKKIWYGEMKIPIKSFDSRPAKAGNEMRINCFRIQGKPKPDRVYVAWNPPNNTTYHTPEAFGRIVLVK